MKKIITFLYAVIITILPLSVYAMDGIEARRIDSEQINYDYAKCYYEVKYGSKFIFSINIKGSTYDCPRDVIYDPVTGRVREY